MNTALLATLGAKELRTEPPRGLLSRDSYKTPTARYSHGPVTNRRCRASLRDILGYKIKFARCRQPCDFKVSVNTGA